MALAGNKADMLEARKVSEEASICSLCHPVSWLCLLYLCYICDIHSHLERLDFCWAIKHELFFMLASYVIVLISPVIMLLMLKNVFALPELSMC